MNIVRRTLSQGTDETHRVTTLELFFDLVFVFAFTQVTALVAYDLSLKGVVRGLVLLTLIWWAWGCYAWLCNQAKADVGVVRAALLVALTSMFVVALAIPEAWSDSPEGVDAPLLIAVCLAVVRLVHVGVYFIAASGDRQLQRQVLRMATAAVVASVLLVVGAVLGGPAQTALWLAALAVDLGGTYASGSDWRVNSAAHLAERHGLIFIIALGESFIAIGVGAEDQVLTWSVVAAAVMGIAISLSLWWTYFDVTSLFAERVLAKAEGSDRTRMARDSYSYLHLPMIAGIIFLAVGLKKVLLYVSTDDHHELPTVAALCLIGGLCAYLLAIVAFRYRNIRSLSASRVVAAAALVAITPAVMNVSALVALALAAAVMVLLIAFESIRYAEDRSRIRSAGH